MSKTDIQYHNLVENIIHKGFLYEDQSRKTQCFQINNAQLVFDNSGSSLPAITTKKLFFKSIITELIWFLQGRTNIGFLVRKNCNIWDKDAYNWYLKDAKETGYIPMHIKDFIEQIRKGDITYNQKTNYKLGDVGRNYGAQWRNWTGVDYHNGDPIGIKTDQIVNLLLAVQENPFNRRNILTAWNPLQLHETALPPCHWSFELLPKYNKEGELDLDFKWHQRSVDTFLGLPFNITSYAILNKMFSKLLKMGSGELIADLSNVHIYMNHMEKITIQMKNNPHMYIEPTISFHEDLIFPDKLTRDNLNEFFSEQLQPHHIIIEDYNSYPPIKAPMEAPIIK